jgi:RNA polymerase sigma-70 factor (ECF subfamily)
VSGIVQLFRGRRGKRDTFVELLRPHIEILYRMAYRWTQSQHEAEDLVQDILTRLASRVDELQKVEVLRPWLIKILYNRYVDLYRRQRNSPVEYEHDTWLPDETELGSRIERAADDRDQISQLHDQQTLQKALQRLDHGQRDVVLLHDMEGYTALEVSEILDINVGTVKSRLHRARNHLKKILSPGTF